MSNETHPQDIRGEVLDFLEQGLEFCEIKKENIEFNTGEFWLICNNRPFYAEYDNGNVNYELNGWGFLKKDSSLWNELKDCDFYKSEKINEDYNLIFYCPKDFNSTKIISKIYFFDSSSFKMNKSSEGDFLEIVDNDIKETYNFLTECKRKKFTLFQQEDYPVVLLLTFDCNGEDYITATDLLTIQPPILTNSDLSYRERAKTSFEKSFDCDIDEISSTNSLMSVSSMCKNKELIVDYNFQDVPYLVFRIECSEDIQTCLKIFGKHFIFPPFKDDGTLELVRDEEGMPQYSIYRKDGEIILVANADENVFFFNRKSERVW